MSPSRTSFTARRCRRPSRRPSSGLDQASKRFGRPGGGRGADCACRYQLLDSLNFWYCLFSRPLPILRGSGEQVLGGTPSAPFRHIGSGRLPQGASRRLGPQHTPQVRPPRRTPARPDGADCRDRPPFRWRPVLFSPSPSPGLARRPAVPPAGFALRHPCHTQRSWSSGPSLTLIDHPRGSLPGESALRIRINPQLRGWRTPNRTVANPESDGGEPAVQAAAGPAWAWSAATRAKAWRARSPATMPATPAITSAARGSRTSER